MSDDLIQLFFALEQRQRQGRPLQLFLRDDDVDEDEVSLRTLLQICSSHHTPLNLAVIPGKLTDRAIVLLNEYLQHRPDLIELNQHGWQHLSHEREGKKSEFGPSRTLDQQLADIAAGQERMTAAFGSNWVPVFVPPWNRCTATTAKALEQLGFRALSRDAGQSPFANCGLQEIPVTLDIFTWRGGAKLRSTNELAKELTQQIQSQNRVGIMLHHKVMDDLAFELLNQLLRLFNRFPIVQPHTFQRLLVTIQALERFDNERSGKITEQTEITE